MDNSLRSPVINLAASLIIGASLIVSASIVAHKPEALGASSSPSVVDGKPKALPPIAQDAVSSQFRQQVLGGPDVHTRQFNSKPYTLADVKVKQVIYSAKDDKFMVIYNWIWQGEGAHAASRPDSDVETLENDGYGHYYGSATFGGMFDNSPIHSADVTIR